MGRSAKTRIDQLLVERGLAPSRERAQALVMAGLVYSGEKRIAKSGDMLARDAPIELRGQDHPWVSRGGVKLAHALSHFGFTVEGAVSLDLGASTGGFTDVLLRHGAAKVYAVDVGHGQLAWTLRQDARVVVLEGVNARNLTRNDVPDPVDVIVCDVSFIGLEKVLPAAFALTRPGARLIALIKPQFQAGRDKVGKGGVVRDPAVHEAVCRGVADWIATQQGWAALGITESPITGPKGNREFLIAARRDF